MPLLTDTLGYIFTIAVWVGFSFFLFLAAYGGWIITKVLTITWRVAYARWRWKRYQREMEQGNLLFAHKLSQEFIREVNKTALTEPTGGNPFGWSAEKNFTTPTHNETNNSKNGSKGGVRSRKDATQQ